MRLELNNKPVSSVITEIIPPGYQLLPGVNQLYELDLAISELRTLTKDELVRRSAFFKLADGEETIHYKLCKDTPIELDKSTSLRLRSFMQAYQFKTAYATHGLFPYRGKFHPQMIKALINVIHVEQDEKILDPMMGSGTLNIEASLMGIDSIGIDISPFCVLMAKAKANALSLSPQPISKCLQYTNEVFDYFQQSELLFATQESVTEIPKKLQFLKDERYLEYLRLCYLDTLGYAARRKNKDTRQLFSILLTKYYNVLYNFANNRKRLGIKLGTPEIMEGDARDLRKCGSIEDNSIGGIVTSPPYSFAIDYLKGDKAQLDFMGVNTENLKKNMIGLKGKDHSNKVAEYLRDMQKVISEMYRVLKKGKYAAIVIGTNTSQLRKIAEYLGGVKLEDELVKIANAGGFTTSQRISRPIEGIRNSIRNEEILIFRKD